LLIIFFTYVLITLVNAARERRVDVTLENTLN